MRDEITSLLAALGSGPVFVHIDAFRAARLVKHVRDRTSFLDSHIALLRQVTEGRTLLCPTFNYDFGKTRVLDLRSSPSHLGPVTERFRTNAAEWRTSIPIFPVAGIGGQPRQSWGEGTDPFGAGSMFAELIEKDGVILYYGDTFDSNTLVHQAERVHGGPMYRYDKVFAGSVIDGKGVAHEGTLVYHVRPFGTGLDYDWRRLQDEALAAGVCRRLDRAPEILAASARALYDLWVSDMRSDPFALLDDMTRKWVEPAIEELGRRFVLTDFEGPPA